MPVLFSLKGLQRFFVRHKSLAIKNSLIRSVSLEYGLYVFFSGACVFALICNIFVKMVLFGLVCW